MGEVEKSPVNGVPNDHAAVSCYPVHYHDAMKCRYLYLRWSRRSSPERSDLAWWERYLAVVAKIKA